MIVGVTGGIGAGKSTVCQTFADLGGLVIDADVVGHETIRDSDVIEKLADEFGADILDSDGQVVRPLLGQRAFASDAQRDKLNAIVWLPLRALLRKKIQQALGEDHMRPVVVDAALLVERGDPKSLVDELVVVTAPDDIRMKRTMNRLGISDEEVRDRIAAQLPQAEKVRVADFVIENDSTPGVCRERAAKIWQDILDRM
ncbi:MAG: dephospho-CoA kinase [Candidatus Latescibacteria bacterium]|nr:dephospho-CoA kinase [Candidatus Latescibacterota bacterium]